MDLFLGKSSCVDVKTESGRMCRRVVRLVVLIAFLCLYIKSMLLHQFNVKTAPVAFENRKEVFPNLEKVAERITEQETSPHLGQFMIGPDVAKVLNILQQVCKNRGGQDEGMEDWFECNIMRIDWVGQHPNEAEWKSGVRSFKNFAGIPLKLVGKDMCSEEYLLHAVETGTGAPYGDMPKEIAIHQAYDLQEQEEEVGNQEGIELVDCVKGYLPESVHEEDGNSRCKLDMGGVWHINSGYPLFDPFFYSDNKYKYETSSPLAKINAKLNAIARHQGVVDAVEIAQYRKEEQKDAKMRDNAILNVLRAGFAQGEEGLAKFEAAEAVKGEKNQMERELENKNAQKSPMALLQLVQKHVAKHKSKSNDDKDETESKESDESEKESEKKENDVEMDKPEEEREKGTDESPSNADDPPSEAELIEKDNMARLEEDKEAGEDDVHINVGDYHDWKKEEPDYELGISAFEDDADFIQAAKVRSRPTDPADIDEHDFSKLKKVDLNHHWDVLMMCDPYFVRVILEMRTTRKDPPTWWRYDYQWTRTARNLNMYETRMESKTGISFTRINRWSTAYPMAALILFIILFFIDVLAIVLFVIPSLLNLISKKKPIRRIVANFIDPIGFRVLYLNWFMILLENGAALATICGFCISIWRVMDPADQGCVFVDFETCKSAWAIAKEKFTGYDLFAQFLFFMFAYPLAHAVACILYLVRVMEFALMGKGTQYLLLTFIFAFWPLIAFGVLFVVMLIGFALLFNSIFGSLFVQFYTLPRSMYMLLLYAFGFERLSDLHTQVNPWIEVNAGHLQASLLVFQIIVVTILLNVFTTIIINAYSVAASGDEAEVKLAQMQEDMWNMVREWYGMTPEEDRFMEAECAVIEGAIHAGGRDVLQVDPQESDEEEELLEPQRHVEQAV